MKSTAFCITGWHFPEEFYQKITALTEVEIYIISHKQKEDIPTVIFDMFSADQLLIQSNIGYDWGCYQQFIASGLWRKSEIIYFMHDDILIQDFGFINQVEIMLQTYSVIGNGKGAGNVSYTSVSKHPYAYAHSSWKPDLYDFEHSTVRGSFFATSRDALEKLDSFEVFWDPFKLFVEFGNWSTKASCGKMQDTLGPACFGYLSDTFGKSDYITEFVRGKQNGDLIQIEGINKQLFDFVKRISRVYLEIYYREKQIHPRSFWLIILRLLIKLFSSKLY